MDVTDASAIGPVSRELTHPKYRPDIDGLRAVAVLSVIGFHAFAEWVTGGFTGVDVFFIISGYMISSIIFENLKSGSFSFAEFYARRVRRIFPALVVVLAACLAFGWFFLLGGEYKDLGWHITGGAGFVSNLFLWSESGYFETASETKPLLHLWSLGIEEQFYIVWPLLLWLASRLRLNGFLIILVVAIGSFVWNVTTIWTDPIAAFYSPQTRFWELALGALLAYAQLYGCADLERLDRRFGARARYPWLGRFAGSPTRLAILRHAASLAGAALIALGVLTIDKKTPFPGTAALLPTLGTVLIIAAGPGAIVNRAILSTRVFVWFGLISYPLYLWHWPLLSFTTIMESQVPDLSDRVIAVLAAIALAWLTFRLIETPIRIRPRGLGRTIAVAATMLLVGSAGYLTYAGQGFDSRNPSANEFLAYFNNPKPDYPYFAKLGIIERYRTDCNFYDVAADRAGRSTQVPLKAIDTACTTKARAADKVVFIWGDSHASQLNWGVERHLPPNWEILVVATSGCEPSFSFPEQMTEVLCEKSNWLAAKTIEQVKPEVVLLAQQRNHDFEKMKRLSEHLLQMGVKKVVYAGLAPQWEVPLPTIIARKLMYMKADNVPERLDRGLRRSVLDSNAALGAKAAGAPFVLVDLVKFFCNAQGCLTRIGRRPAEDSVTWDYGHLTPVASDYLGANLLAEVLFGDDGKTK